ncbi:DUF4878 domain-containing protein [Clostridiisalibacter paucivorans]|uniref:DUF4878 domain-containing protein n=1 Tax=Clostridiisalibacter paucivorans TaxID=408753 RepID=UPI00047BB0B4|nr:DUF4878 domain-containing protein [Clostridiisalibacter paucivorans]
MKRLLFLILASLLVLTIGACSEESRPNTPEHTVEAFLSSYKKGDIVKSVEYLENKTNNGIEQMRKSFMENKNSKSNQAFLKAFSKIQYKIIDSEIKEDSAVVNTKIIAPDLAKILGQLMKEAFQVNISKDSINSRENDIDEMIEDKFLEKVSSDDILMFTNTIKIKLIKKDNVWLIKNSNELERAITGNLVNTIYP